MKKLLICSVAALAILLAGGTALTKEKGRTKTADKETRRVSEKKKLSEEEKQWKEKLESMTPEERRVAIAKKALETELGPWQQVRKIALEEKAAKTVAAIDKIIADRQQQFKKKLAAMKDRPAKADRPKGERTRKEGARRERKKAETEE